MNIILGESALEQVGNKYIALELDTIKIGNSTPVKAYCVVESIPLPDFPKVESLRKVHATLIEEYHNQNWGFCEQALEQLHGSWNKELDSFYTDLSSRIAEFKENPPGDSWTGVISK